MKTLVIGLGISGRSAADFLLKQGHQVWGVDSNNLLLQTNPEIQKLRQKGLHAFHDSQRIEISQFNSVVVSPGIPQSDKLYAQAVEADLDIMGEVELACRYLKGTMLGVTGTNGKTTVTLLVAHILNANGKPARALGNMGVALTSDSALEAAAAKEIMVVELSSFQLDTLHSPVLDAAVILNITPDHLDRYRDMEDYAKSKMHIAKCLKPNGDLFIEDKCNEEFGYLLAGIVPKVYGYRAECDIYSDLSNLYVYQKKESMLPAAYQGKRNHDIENILAAYGLCKFVGISAQQFFKGLSTFRKPPHRIEFIRKWNNVSFYDDSKGTNIDAVIRAVNSLEGSIVLIAGGVDKGFPYTSWIDAFAGKVKCICAIGQAAPKIQRDIGHKVPVQLFDGLEAAVTHASQRAQPGDNVLLSPGCSSFDMFRDYAHRGEEFQRIVTKLNPMDARS